MNIAMILNKSKDKFLLIDWVFVMKVVPNIVPTELLKIHVYTRVIYRKIITILFLSSSSLYGLKK